MIFICNLLFYLFVAILIKDS